MIKSTWENFERLDFTFKDREAILILPKTQNNKADGTGKLALYTEYFGAFPNTAIELIHQGYHLAYLSNMNRWGVDEDQHIKREFIDYIAEKYNLSRRFVPIGMSCGGLHAVNFAYLYPEYISVLYIDAPVLNLLSCPMGYGVAIRDENVVRECCEAIGMTESELLGYRKQPIDKLHK